MLSIAINNGLINNELANKKHSLTKDYLWSSFLVRYLIK